MLLRTRKYYSGTTKYYKVFFQYYKVLLQYYSELQSTTQVLQSTTPVLQSTTPVLLRTTKYCSITTPYYKVLLQFYSSSTPYYSVLQSTTPVLQRTTPVLLRTTKYYSSTTRYYKVLLQYYKVLLQYYSSTTKYYSSTTPSTTQVVLVCGIMPYFVCQKKLHEKMCQWKWFSYSFWCVISWKVKSTKVSLQQTTSSFDVTCFVVFLLATSFWTTCVLNGFLHSSLLGFLVKQWFFEKNLWGNLDIILRPRMRLKGG